MFRLWCKLFDESNHLMKDMVYANSDIDINRTKKIFDGIKEASLFGKTVPFGTQILFSCREMPEFTYVQVRAMAAQKGGAAK